MKKFIFSFILYFWVLAVHASANQKECKITIFDVGQGNCVLIRYNNQAIMVDSGSNELMHSTMNDRLYRVENPRCLLVPNNYDKDNFHTEEALSETGLEKSAQYKNRIITSILAGLPSKNQKKILKTLVISHGDEDHYNLVTKIFSAHDEFSIETVILGGFKESYIEEERTKDPILTWITKGLEEESIKEVIYAGFKNGKDLKQGIARPYCSLIPHNNRTSNEKNIEKSLQFSSANDQYCPKIEILSMNAGHAVNQVSNSNYMLDPDTNTNSIVLRIHHKNASFLIPGDAGAGTWNHILSGYHPQSLLTTYYLLSHHGSLASGSNPQRIIDVLKPQQCFISAGCHARYHHPRGEVIDLLHKHALSPKKSTKHYISYYKKKENEGTPLYFRKRILHCIYSTQDKGTMQFNLAPNIRVDYDRDRTYKNHLRFIEIKEQTQPLNSRSNAKKLKDTHGTNIFTLQDNHASKPSHSTEKEIILEIDKEVDMDKEYYILMDYISGKIKKIERLQDTEE